jgi:archaellum biogenesis protein FlaJ (TadC family)
MRTLYVSLCISLGILAILFEEHILPTGFIPSTPGANYVINLISLIVTLGSVFFAMQLFKKEKQDKTLIEGDAEAKRIAHLKWNGRRIGIIFSAAFTNLIIYYGGTYNESAMYSLIITLIGALICWPTKLHPQE